jgi:hypothetical protein
MPWYFWSYWWLIFPVGAFVFGAWDRWLAYKRSRDHLELIRTFAAQGKEVPPELMRQMGDVPPDGAPPPPPGYGGYGGGYGGYGGYGGWGYPRYMRRAWRGYYRWGPYWQWRSAIVSGAVAAGFWWASEYADWPGTEEPFRLVAIIMTVVAAGNLLVAVLSTAFRDK